MECAVYDTYVTKKDGKIMHFDVIVEGMANVVEAGTAAASKIKNIKNIKFPTNICI